jgi:hypothetical protein
MTNTENPSPEAKLSLNKAMLGNLESIRKWALFLSIVGFVFMGLLVIFGFSFGYIMKALGQETGIPGVPPLFLGIIYLFFALLYFFPILYLFRFSTNMKKSIRDTDTGALGVAFRNLKSHYAFIGVLMAIVLGLYILMGIIIAIVAIVT